MQVLNNCFVHNVGRFASYICTWHSVGFHYHYHSAEPLNANTPVYIARRDLDKLHTKNIDKIIPVVDISGDVTLASLAEHDGNHDMG